MQIFYSPLLILKAIKYFSDFDAMYLLEADEDIPLVYREDESKGVKWIPFSEATDETMVDWVRPVNKKLIKCKENNMYVLCNKNGFRDIINLV